MLWRARSPLVVRGHALCYSKRDDMGACSAGGADDTSNIARTTRGMRRSSEIMVGRISARRCVRHTAEFRNN
jgi:hypothetical protein